MIEKKTILILPFVKYYYHNITLWIYIQVADGHMAHPA